MGYNETRDNPTRGTAMPEPRARWNVIAPRVKRYPQAMDCTDVRG